MMRKLLLPISAVVLMAADPSWKTKSIAQWGEDDAHQLLTSSPWVKRVAATALPPLSQEQRREGGATGGGKDVIPAAFSDFLGTGTGSRQSVDRSAANSGDLRGITVRWESALPVRAAELKTREIGAPSWESADDYVLAVYDVPLRIGKHEKRLTDELKGAALLKRDGAKGLKPSRVQLLPRANGLAIVVYQFPRSWEITNEDNRVTFEAQIDRLVVAQSFEIEKMRFQGKLEL